VVVTAVCGRGIFNTGMNVELTPLGVLPLIGSPVPLNSVSGFCGHNCPASTPSFEANVPQGAALATQPSVPINRPGPVLPSVGIFIVSGLSSLVSNSIVLASDCGQFAPADMPLELVQVMVNALHNGVTLSDATSPLSRMQIDGAADEFATRAANCVWFSPVSLVLGVVTPSNVFALRKLVENVMCFPDVVLNGKSGVNDPG
jgi:hypothetical protein